MARTIFGPGAQRQMRREAANSNERAAAYRSTPGTVGEFSRQVLRRQSRKAAKAAVATQRRDTIKNRRKRKVA